VKSYITFVEGNKHKMAKMFKDIEDNQTHWTTCNQKTLSSDHSKLNVKELAFNGKK
jgi:hypothetical protein